jgi:fructose-1,6-bisphosphatase I
VDKQKVVDEIFHSVADVAPHISSGLLRRREYVGEENPSAEKQLEADVWANEFLKEEITSIDGVGEFASEEEHEVVECGDGLSVTVDPLDGSSNIPTNNIVGTIVGIYDEELPCRGQNLVSAFYVVYGPLTSFTIAKNGQVDEYVLEESEGDDVELHKASEDIEIPEPYVYGFGGNKHWHRNFERLEDDISDDLKLRYGGAMVGDVNQVLHQGGVFGYPAREDAENGKLRLIFEANPIAFIFEAAGGKSSDGEKSILRKDAEELHQRTPVFVGSRESVEQVENTI